MSCEPWRELLIDHVARELDEASLIRLEQHLGECPDCTREERALRGLMKPVECSPGPLVEERLLARARPLLEASRPQLRRPTREEPRPAASRLLELVSRRIPAYAAAVLVVVAALAGIWAGTRPSGEPRVQRVVRKDQPARGRPLDERRSPMAFATTPGDAVSLAHPTSRDTL